MKKIRSLTVLLMLVCVYPLALAQHGIIPQPVSYKPNNAVFELDRRLVIQVDTENQAFNRLAEDFGQFLQVFDLDVDIREKARHTWRSKVLKLQQAPELVNHIGPEGYQLDIQKNTIILRAATATGAFYGLQSLKQLMPVPSADGLLGMVKPISITGCTIEDYPRFEWRGLMLDVSRHFFPVDDVKAFIDKMSEYKFNVLHWHLTDDQGWRLEIKSLPRLTGVGAWRVERFGRFGEQRQHPQPGEKAVYGGFYSHEDVRELVDYAAQRHITIVPEIDMPGHSMAALAAYPELSVNKEPKFVPPGSKFSEWYEDGSFEMTIENTLNPADEAVYEFADKVFSEVAALFPGPYIHMGGDEAYHGFWERDDGVLEFMQQQGIEDTHGLQGYFVKRIEDIINSKNKTMIGWDEILSDELSTSSVVMSWRGMQGGIDAARRGNRAVMSPTTFAYLDYTQGDHSVENPIYASLSLETSYEFEPVPEGVDPAYILGGQGNLWTEAVPNLSFAYYMVYPRAFALSEVLWSPAENKQWDSFIDRTEQHFSRFADSGTNISRAVYDPVVEVHFKEQRLVVALHSAIPGADIYYTINNTYPPKFGTRYSGEFEVPEGRLDLRTQLYRDGEPLGRELILSRKVLVERATAAQPKP